MLKLAPKESKADELPEPVGGLVMVNETIAGIDYEAAIEGSTLKLTIKGLHIGNMAEPEFQPVKKTWVLT